MSDNKVGNPEAVDNAVFGSTDSFFDSLEDDVNGIVSGDAETEPKETPQVDPINNQPQQQQVSQPNQENHDVDWKNTQPFHRKLSVTVQLSSPDEYEGGDFEFDFSNVEMGTRRHPLKELSGKGSMVIFPSDTFHRVNPVTKGTRYSLVIWCVGDPFR